MLRTFTAGNYRNVKMGGSGYPKFGPINLLVGPNNAGKSNFIRAMSFMPEMLLGDTSPTAFLHTLEEHGRAEMVNWANDGEFRKSHGVDVMLSWLMDDPLSKPRAEKQGSAPPEESLDLVYHLGIRVGDSGSFPSGFYIGNESIFKARSQDGQQPTVQWEGAKLLVIRQPPQLDQVSFLAPAQENMITIAVETNETILKQTKSFLKNEAFYKNFFPDFDKVSESLQIFAKGFHSYSSTELNLRLMAEAVKIDVGVRTLDPEGRQFVNVLRYLDQKYDFLDEYTERLQELLPDLKKVKIVDASDTHKRLDLSVGRHRYHLPEMSDGTLRALWLALILFSPERGSVLALDEPELNLHPAWLKVVGGWLQRFRSAEQIFVSTHSPELLDTFTEGFQKGEVTLFVFDRGDKGMHEVAAAELTEFFKEGWQLGDLYRVGEPKLGGWPW
ncbi:MAG: ATP-binding protein [Polyangia bacterium]